jgi:V/A-type H+-transporting ATPase subunit C
MTDSTYIGKYGQLKVLSRDFLSNDFIEQLSLKNSSEIFNSLSSTSYKAEIDSLSGLYKLPDLFEVVINAHAMRMMRYALSAVPPSAKDFIVAYLSKFDIENIKLVLSSKMLGYDVEHTENFLMVQRNIPAGIISGIIKSDEYKDMVSQKDLDSVVKSLTRYGYGVILLKYLEDAKKSGNLSNMIFALDVYYYDKLFEAYRFHDAQEGNVREFLQDTIDIKNIMSVIKAAAFSYKIGKEEIIPNGKITESVLVDLSTKSLDAIKERIPFKIDYAIDAYKKEPHISYIDVALKRELYKKYLGVFRRSSFSVGFILEFMIRSEIERDELRNVWLNTYYGVRKEITEGMKVLKHISG